MSQKQLREICGEVSVKESYRLWDEHLPHGLGGIRNRSFRPVLFPCNECTTGSSTFPGLLTSISAEPAGALWVTLNDRFVDGCLVNARCTHRRVARRGGEGARTGALTPAAHQLCQRESRPVGR
jgi:hypothetical protein